MLTLIAEAFRIWVMHWQLEYHEHNRHETCLCRWCQLYRDSFWGEQQRLFEPRSVEALPLLPRC